MNFGLWMRRATLLAVFFSLISPGSAQDLFGGKYLPYDQMLSRHKVPEWFHDAKLGIFPVWGLYSAPGWATPTGELGKVDPKEWFLKNPYAEWYWNYMKLKESETWKRHVKVYGEDFTYEDFIPVFAKESRQWDPEEWAELFASTGARYVVFTTKFHDGYPLWPSKVKNPHRDVTQLGAVRDYVGELTEAVRDHGMKMGLYYSGGLDWTFTEEPIATFMDLMKTAPKSKEYADYADAHWRELIEKYKPVVLWNDIGYPERSEILQVFADYYNEIPEGVINNRFGFHHHDFTTPEYQVYDDIVEKKWESTRGLGFSFGYNQAEGPEHTLSADKLIDQFVDVVSKNGNLLLAVGPKADGTIPEMQVDRLKALGRWLKVNGEAIFETRPWVTAEGKTSGGDEVRFTRKGEVIYAILLSKPAESQITIEHLWPADDCRVTLLGQSGDLAWERSGTDMKITLPDNLPASEAYALKITPKPWKLRR